MTTEKYRQFIEELNSLSNDAYDGDFVTGWNEGLDAARELIDRYKYSFLRQPDKPTDVMHELNIVAASVSTISREVEAIQKAMKEISSYIYRAYQKEGEKEQ